MKPSFQSHGVLLLLFLLSTYSTVCALRPVPKQGDKERMISGMIHKGIELEEDDPPNLMGTEECPNGDEECLKRRLIAEAHLDYIYTQHHKP